MLRSYVAVLSFLKILWLSFDVGMFTTVLGFIILALFPSESICAFIIMPFMSWLLLVGLQDTNSPR